MLFRRASTKEYSLNAGENEKRLKLILLLILLSVMAGYTSMPLKTEVDKYNDAGIEDDHFSLAMTHYLLDNNETAINELNKIKKLSPGNEAVVNYIKGLCNLRIGRNEPDIWNNLGVS